MMNTTTNENDTSSHLEEEDELVVLEFFRQATAALDCLPDETGETSVPPQTIADIRQVILHRQTECLPAAVDRVSGSNSNSSCTVPRLQTLLRACGQRPLDFAPQVREAMEQLHHAARSALCRSVLYSELLSSSERSNLLRTFGSITDADVLEFCGLCSAAIRIPAVRQYMQEGTPLFVSQRTTKSLAFPQERLAYLQRLFLQALGYDPDFGTKEIQRLFYTTSTISTFTGQSFAPSPKLQAAFRSMEHEMEQALREITAAIAQKSLMANDDSVTRIVSVTYSEKIIDAVTGQEISTLQDDDTNPNDGSDAAPKSLLISEQQEIGCCTEHADLARQATQLEQEILGELLSLRDEVREERLLQAQAAADAVLQQLASMPSTPERVEYLRSLDAATQRSMAMKKIWDNLVATNGNQPPIISHYSRWGNDPCA
jgi:hypothetical protein